MPLSKRFTSEADNYQNYRPSSFGGNRKDGICTWLAENAEADALVNVNDNCALFRPVSATAKNSYKGNYMWHNGWVTGNFCGGWNK